MNNVVEFQPGSLAGLNNLLYLNASGNKLTTLPDNLFSDTPVLTNLDLSFNQISEISANLCRNLN